MPIPEKATDTALYAFVRVKSQPPFEMDVETNRGNHVDHRGKRKGVGLDKGARLDEGNVNEGCFCFLGRCNARPVRLAFTRISPLCAHRAFLLSPDTGNNRREIGDRQRHFGVVQHAASYALSAGPLTSGDLFQPICRVSIIFN